MASPEQPNTLGNTRLALGVASAALVFGIGLCALIGAQQGWIGAFSVPLLVCGASSAFLGLLGSILGTAGLLGNRSKSTAVTGLALSLLGMCLFLVFLTAVGG
jgi:hypothetical protein